MSYDEVLEQALELYERTKKNTVPKVLPKITPTKSSKRQLDEIEEQSTISKKRKIGD